MEDTKSRVTVWTVVKYIVLINLMIIEIFPFIIMIKRSLEDIGIQNYVAVFKTTNLGAAFYSSIYITVFTVILVHLCSVTAAFGLSKLNIKCKNTIYYYIMSAMMIPPAVSMVPLLITIKKLGLLNNYWSVILPYTALFIPFAVLILKNSLDELPNEIMEAAYIDGASTFKTFYMIILPLCRSSLLVTVIFTAMNAWNEFLYPLMFLKDLALQPLTVIPLRFLGSYVGNIPQVFAAGNLILLPVIILYVFLQKYFEAGFVNGAIKG